LRRSCDRRRSGRRGRPNTPDRGRRLARGSCASDGTRCRHHDAECVADISVGGDVGRTCRSLDRVAARHASGCAAAPAVGEPQRIRPSPDASASSQDSADLGATDDRRRGDNARRPGLLVAQPARGRRTPGHADRDENCASRRHDAGAARLPAGGILRHPHGFTVRSLRSPQVVRPARLAPSEVAFESASAACGYRSDNGKTTRFV
jgi:hypothetical protein